MYTSFEMETGSALLDVVFKAIADPTRRRILQLLAESECSVKELTARFTISQPAVSQHLRELRAARLVVPNKVGLEHRYRLTGGPLRGVYEWSQAYQPFFDPSGHAWAFTTIRPETEPNRAAAKGNSHENRKGGRTDGH